MSEETCRDCANRGDDPDSPHITYCYAWGQRICNVLEGNEDFRRYYDRGYDNGCPHYASGPQRFR